MNVTFRLLSIGFLLNLWIATVSYGEENRVRVGADRFLEADGKSLFAIGAYALPKEMTLAEGRSMGFNLVQVSSDAAGWDSAREAGLMTWYSFGSDLDFESGDIEQKRARVEKIIQQFSGHDALLFWESMDEPAWTDRFPAQSRATASGLKKGYRFLRSLDDRHPVYLNHAPRNTIETLQAYNSACDIVCVDIYPVIPPGMRPMYAITPEGRHGDFPNQTISCVGEYVEKMKAVASSQHSVFVVLQGFAWEALRGEEAESTLVRYPSYLESRFMAYNAITHGARGILYWGLSYVPKDCPFIQDLSKVLNEIREMTPVILGKEMTRKPALRYYERGSSIAAGVEILGRKTGKGVYLIASNTGMDPAAVDFMELPPELAGAGYLNVLGENRSVPITDGKFYDEFEGYGVHVYEYLLESK